MVSLNISKQRLLALAGAAALTLSVAGPAMAADTSQATVTTSVTGGSLSVAVSAGSMTGVTHSINTQHSTGTLTITATDETGSTSGYTVTLQSDDFTGAGSIAATNFTIATLADPVKGVGGGSGPTATSASQGAALGSVQQVMSAAGSAGDGQWTQEVGVDLAVPALSVNGDYSATVTVTIAPTIS